MASTALRPRVVAFATLVAMVAPAFVLGTQTGAAAGPDKTVIASNTTPISIPASGFADPFPGSISVPAGRGVVADVDVTLTGLTHTCLGNLEVMLVSPNGRRATLLSNVRNCSRDPGPIMLTFDDEAPGPVVGEDLRVPLPSGTYLPTDANVNPDPTAPNFAPASLAVFDGGPASGGWHLYVEDNGGGDFGAISGGWSLDIDYTDIVAPTGALAIDAGAALTDSQTIPLTLDATDPTPGTGVTQMRFSNDGTTWSPFRSYAPSASWTLTPGDGTKTVYAQFADDFANLSSVVTDTIVLDTRAPEAKKLTPRNKTAHVPAKTTVSFVASESLEPLTVSTKTVKLTSGGTTVKAKVSYSTAKKKVTLTPAKPLAGDTTYKVKLSKAVTDTAGNGITGKSWSFITA